MEIDNWYRDNFELHLKGRYITLETIFPLLDMYKKLYDISVPGISELGKDIPLIKIGNGQKVILAWSQMHGNESTTTKAVFDFLKFLNQKKYFQPQINTFLKNHTFYVFPILNPDGANLYTRENDNKIDLNRDARELSQKESKTLRQIFKAVSPNLCLNLHDQRSIFGLSNGLPATVSFLAPAADKERKITASRKLAMEKIVKMNNVLQKYIPGQVGRFDDRFNEACVGDTFQKSNVPTILFEAGHYKQDYEREKTREFIFYALLALFDIIGEEKQADYNEYFNIPENKNIYRDIIIRNSELEGFAEKADVAIQYAEKLKNGKIEFVPVIDEIGNLENYFGHIEKMGNSVEILTDSQQKLAVGKIISQIVNKNG